MKTLIIVAGLALALAGCKLTPGSSVNSDEQAFCKTNYKTEDMCVADERCEWKLREDGGAHCRAKR